MPNPGLNSSEGDHLSGRDRKGDFYSPLGCIGFSALWPAKGWAGRGKGTGWGTELDKIS